MTRDHVAERIRRLMALAAPGSGAAEEERRSAAAQVVRLMVEHGLGPGDRTPASAIDLEQVADLSLRVLCLEHTLAAERAAHDADLRRRDAHWRSVVAAMRREERSVARRAAGRAMEMGARGERQALARAGARARDEKLSDERKTEIARAAASARWVKWRELHGVGPDHACKPIDSTTIEGGRR